MFEFLPETRGDLVAIRVRDKLERADYERFLPHLEEAIAKYGKVRLFWEMEDFGGWKPGALAEDLGFDVRHAGDFSRIAMVGERAWQDGMTKAMKPFTPAEVRYYEREERDRALAWIQTGDPD